MTTKVKTIGRALGWVVCACTIPACIAAVAAIVYHYQYARESIQAASVRRAASISADVDTAIHGIEVGLLTLSTSPWLAQGDLRSFHQQARSVLPLLDGASSIYLADRQGRMLDNTLAPFGTALPPANNPELLRQVVESEHPRVSGLFTGSLSNRPMVALAVPIIRNNKVVMVLAATISTDAVHALLKRQRPPEDWIISVQDRTGRILARSRDSARMIAQPISDDLRQAMQRQPSGTLSETTREGTRMLAAYTHSGYTGWSVAVGIPQDGLMRSLNVSIAAMCVVIAQIVGIGLAAAMLTARCIRRAIAALLPAAEALSRSEALDLPADTYEETRQLGAALRRASDKLRRSEYNAHHDVLTGLPNRVFLQTVLPRLQSQAIRHRTTLTLLYLDLDGFKQVNDGLGHAAGDEVLFQAAERIREAIRSADIGIRLGGDEFAVILPDTDHAGAHAIAERIRNALVGDIETARGVAQVSVSIGLAAFPDDCSAVDDLVKLADAAMYRAKRCGKNTVCTAQQVMEPEPAQAPLPA